MALQNSKILILVPGKSSHGGINNYYQTLRKHFDLSIEYLERGTRQWPIRKNILLVLVRILIDAWKFYKLVRTKKYALVQTTTSFSNLSILRDAIYILISKYFNLKVIVFYRGWDEAFTIKVERFYLNLFRFIYFKADAIIDLSSKNIETLRRWGYSKSIYLETTTVDMESLRCIDLEYVKNKYKAGKKGIRILFLSRIEITKGIYEAIDAYNMVRKVFSQVSLTIAGDGSELERVTEYIKDKQIENIEIIGFVEGDKKAAIFKSADLYILPSYSEGMPNSVLEAMAFGLPVITRPVGGIPDFFKNYINGFLIESKDPKDFAEAVEKLLVNDFLILKIAENNYNYAHSRFLSTIVASRVRNIFRMVINSENNSI